MAKLSTIEELVNKTAPAHAPVRIMPRGVPIFCDKLLRGTARFARKVGELYALLNPDNEAALAVLAQKEQRHATLDHEVTWIDIGSVVSFGPDVENMIVGDMIDTTLVLTSNLKLDHPQGESVRLQYVPIVPVTNYEKYHQGATGDTGGIATTVIQVKSKYQIFAGDQIGIITHPEQIGSMTDLDVVESTFLGEISGLLVFELLLNHGIPISIEETDTLYLRAWPAYYSDVIHVPIRRSGEPIGPFLVDYISGRLNQGRQVTEYFSMSIADRSGNSIIGDVSTNSPDTVKVQPTKRMQLINKNFFIGDSTLPSDVLLFWDKVFGSVQHDGINTIMKADDIFEEETGITGEVNCQGQTGDGEKALFGHCCFSKLLIPEIPYGHEWNVSVEANAEATLTVLFFSEGKNPNMPRVFKLCPNQPRTIRIGISYTEESATRVEFALKTVPNASLKVSYWDAVQIAEEIRYGIVARISGEGHWQASGLIIKPYFLSLDDIKAHYDIDSGSFDSGILHL